MYPIHLSLKKNITFRFIVLLIVCFTTTTRTQAQETHSSALYQVLQKNDSLLFDEGFNNCDLRQFEQLVSDHFEFYHDEAGVISSKAAFITSVKNNVCGQHYKARRELAPGTLEVYPLMKNNMLYGAVQTGVHRFYALEKDKPEYFTGKAKFTHVWLLENNEWKLAKGLSYDHQKTDTLQCACNRLSFRFWNFLVMPLEM